MKMEEFQTNKKRKRQGEEGEGEKSQNQGAQIRKRGRVEPPNRRESYEKYEKTKIHNMDIPLILGLETKQSSRTVVKNKTDEEKKRPIESEQPKDKEIENLGVSGILGFLGGENWANISENKVPSNQ